MDTIDPSKQLDAERFQLDKEKLAFEIRKFDVEESKRALESEKLREEIRELKKSWPRKSTSVGPICTLIVAIFGVILAFGTNVLNSNVFKLKNQRDTLGQSVKDLQSEKGRLLASNQTLSGTNKKLLQDESSLKSRVGALTQDKNSLQTQKTNLIRDVSLTELRTQLKVIEDPSDIGPLKLSNKSFQYIFSRATQNGGDPAAIEVVENAYQNDQSSPEIKAALCFVLFEATKQAEWKSALRKISVENLEFEIDPTYYYSSISPIYLELLGNSSVFSSVEKANILRELYQPLKSAPAPQRKGVDSVLSGKLSFAEYELTEETTEHNLESLRILATWDRDATVRFRDPWFDYLGRILNLEDQDFSQDFRVTNSQPRLLAFAPEAYAILMLYTLQGPPPAQFKDGHYVTDLLLIAPEDGGCPAFVNSFPLCQDWTKHMKEDWDSEDKERYSQHEAKGIQIWHASLPAYEQWLIDNRELVVAWLDPSFHVLRDSSDKTMEKLFDRQWITMSDLKQARR